MKDKKTNSLSLMVTGGAGFIGSHFIRQRLRNTKDFIINVDALTYAGNINNLPDKKEDTHYQFVHADIGNLSFMKYILMEYNVDIIIHFAAETHVDRSIQSSTPFIASNVAGTQALLELARINGTRFIQISTDEVYGSLGADGCFTESSPLQPNSPYAASKAGADCLVRAYHETYGLFTNITRCTNNYGPYQNIEKFIPRMITNALQGKELPVYGKGENIRDWLHVYDHCTAIDAVIEKGKPGEIYNIGANNERKNIQIVETIVAELGAGKQMITCVPDRAGHDYRYALDCTKIKRELGWNHAYSFEQGLKETINWYRNHQDWWKSELGVDDA